MDAIKDYKRKWDKLWLFFSMLPKTEIGIKDKGKHKGERYDSEPYKFAGQYRKDFDSVLNQAESLFYSCGIDIIELEGDIADNTTKIDIIRKFVSDYMKWPQYDPSKSQWLNSLLDAKIISKEEFYRACNHIRFCADTMRGNVQAMKLLLDKYDVSQPPQELQPKATTGGKEPNVLIDVFKDKSKFDEVVGAAKMKTDQKALVRYFDELVKKDILSDFPTAGALVEHGINVDAKSYTSQTSYRRSKNK